MAMGGNGWTGRFPQEIINQICHFVDDQKTSKNLRLVSKCFRDTAAINVFRALILYPDRKKWAVLNEIGEVPEIARLVTTILLFRIANITDIMPRSFESWVNSLMDRAPETWTMSRMSELKAAWQKQVGWAETESDFRAWYFNPQLEPLVHLEKFPNLQNVETIGYWALNHRNLHPGRWNCMVKLWGVKRVDECSTFYDLDPNMCLELFCRQLERSQKNISNLTVTCINEILDRASRWMNLANLSSLTMDLCADANYAVRTVRPHPLPRRSFSDWFLSATPKLKDLKIIQRWTTYKRKGHFVLHRGERVEALEPALDIFESLASKNVRFPMLQTLHLQHVTTTASSLTEFLSFHRKTLVSLKIDRPCIQPKDWNEMKERVKQEAEQGYYGPKSGCEVTLTDAMTDPMGIDKEWKPFDSLIW